MDVEIPKLAISLPLDDIKCLVAAEGYVELGMYEEALGELQQTSRSCQDLPVVRTLELCVCAGLEQKYQARMARRPNIRKRSGKSRSRARRRPIG